MTDSNEAKQPHAKPFVSSVTSNSSLAGTYILNSRKGEKETTCKSASSKS